MRKMNNYFQLIDRIGDTFQSIGYYKKNIIRNYSYLDFFEDTPSIKKTDLAVFGQIPYDYRSACFSIKINDESLNSLSLVHSIRALGSPHIFIINNGKTEHWRNDQNDVLKIKEIQTRHLTNYIRYRKRFWKPSEIIRQKTNFGAPVPRQEDLFVDSGLLPALEYEASLRIDALIKKILFDIEQKSIRYGFKLDVSTIFRILFKLLTAKLLSDREIATRPAINFNDFKQTLQAVSNYYGNEFNLSTKKIPASVLNNISSQIENAISLKNLSVDTLTYIYENTFVSPESRRTLGIHSTPSFIADYIVAQLPLEKIPQNNWLFFDPMCGHGIFLISAIRKMRNELPLNWTGRKRHDFFTKHIMGTDIEGFSIEVAKMCLTLADFPESNGWNLKKMDVFNGKFLEKISHKISFLVGNPPFEYGLFNNIERPKPAYLLDRILPNLSTNAAIGLVLPVSFLDSVDYKQEREMLLKNFNITSITNLPSNTFMYSNAETTTIVAVKTQLKSVHSFDYSEINNADLELFKKELKTSWRDKVSQKTLVNKVNFIIKVPYLRDVWESLSHLPTLKTIADIKIGVQHEPSKVNPKKDYKNQWFKNSAPAITESRNSILQYQILRTRYIPTAKSLKRRNAWDYDWSKEKIVIPAGRISNGPWKFCAAIDYKKRYATRNFYVVWSKSKSIPIELISAVLNSPLASAFVYTHSSERTISKRVYGQIPIPANLTTQPDLIQGLVLQYLKQVSKNDWLEAEKTLLMIDSEILRLYHLPPKIETRILKLFDGHKRPVPFNFERYYPYNYDSWIPLRVFISEKYKNNNIAEMLDHLPTIKNKKTVEVLLNIGDEI